jgi:hypothetical protein
MIDTSAANVALFSAFLFSVLSITFALDKKNQPYGKHRVERAGFLFF